MEKLTANSWNGKIEYVIFKSGYPDEIGGIDGIGRHARFRFLWATVRVRVPHSAWQIP